MMTDAEVVESLIAQEGFGRFHHPEFFGGHGLSGGDA